MDHRPRRVVVHDVGLAAHQHDHGPAHGQGRQRLIGGVQQQYAAAAPDRAFAGGRTGVDAVQDRDRGCAPPRISPPRPRIGAGGRGSSCDAPLRPPTDSPPRIGVRSHDKFARVRWSPVNSGDVTAGAERRAEWLAAIRDNGRRDTATAVLLRRSGWPRHVPCHRRRGSTSWSARTKSCVRCTPRRISTPPRSGCGCSSSSTGGARAPTPISAAIRGCGCGTARSRSGYIERDAWLRCMHTAVASIDSADPRRRTPQGAAGLSGDGRAVDGQLAVLT